MLCVSEMAETINPTELAQLLGNNCTNNAGTPKNDVFIVDCRSLLVADRSRIQGSLGVHCPPIVKRRFRGNIPLENIIRNPSRREAFEAARSPTVVVYDEGSTTLSDMAKDSNVCLVIKTLSENLQNQDKRLYILQGGFQQFYLLYPHLCTSGAESSTEGGSSVEISISLPSNEQSPNNSLDTSVTGNSHWLSAINNSPIPSNSLQATRYYTRERADSYSRRNKEGPKEVLPWLLIGSLHHASQVENLLKLGVTTLVNMAASTESSPVPSVHFTYKNVPVRDSVSADILQWFPAVIDSIEEVRRSKGKVLVHCQAGISRSATICIAYLMFYKGLDLEQAFDFLKEKRAVISPNLNFMRQLVEFQGQLKDGTAQVRPRLPSLKSPKVTLNLLGGGGGAVDARDAMCGGSASSGGSSLNLSVTPCMHNTFVFDSPFSVPPPTTTTTCSTSTPVAPLQSPLLSPS